MFYSEPTDHDLLDRMPAGGGVDPLRDRLAGLARSGGVVDLLDLLSLLPAGGGVDPLRDRLARLVRSGGVVDLLDLLSLLPAGGGVDPLRDRLAGLARSGGVVDLLDLLSLLPAGGGVDPLRDRLAVLVCAGGFVPPGRWVWRVHDQVEVAAWQRLTTIERPEPTFDVFVEERSAEFLLEGYPEYEGHESTPPRYYRREVYSGRIATSSWAPDWDMTGHWWSGSKTWPAADGGSHVSFTGVFDSPDLPDEADPRWSGPAVPIYFAPYSFPPGTLVRDKYDTESSVDTSGPDFVRRQGKGAFQGDPGDIDHSVTYGYLERHLDDEHTPCDALLEAVAGLDWEAGSGIAATAASWLDDPEEPRRWQGTQAQWILAGDGLIVGQEYRLRWRRNGVLQEVLFVASAETWQYQEVVPCGALDDEWVLEFAQPFDFAAAAAIYDAMEEHEKGPVELLDGDEAESFFVWSPAWLGAEYVGKWVVAESWLEVSVLGLEDGQEARLGWRIEDAAGAIEQAKEFVIGGDPHVEELPVSWRAPNRRTTGRLLAAEVYVFEGGMMGLDDIAVAGGRGCPGREVLSRLPDVGGRAEDPLRLALLPDVGGSLLDFVSLDLLVDAGAEGLEIDVTPLSGLPLGLLPAAGGWDDGCLPYVPLSLLPYHFYQPLLLDDGAAVQLDDGRVVLVRVPAWLC